MRPPADCSAFTFTADDRRSPRAANRSTGRWTEPGLLGSSANGAMPLWHTQATASTVLPLGDVNAPKFTTRDTIVSQPLASPQQEPPRPPAHAAA
ncbi:MAG: hypothetical protein DLM62_15190 [Pseudonocardiales bacterium]|nr:MAG: hypothetical protein DLM62_15190 [Pseudonocardiales bacterium]